jgi:hypothetical protein
MNEILIPWKKITRGLPRGKKFADDRAPTMEEIRRLIEYPDRRIMGELSLLCVLPGFVWAHGTTYVGVISYQ